MKHRGHADHGGCRADLVAHGILRSIYIAVYRRKRAVIADRAAQNVGHTVFFAAVDDAVVDFFFADKVGDAAVMAHTVDGFQMIVVAVGLGNMRVDILPQRSAQVRAFQIMRGQRVAGQNGVDIAVFDQTAHGCARVTVKGEGRAHDPHDFAVLAVMAQHFVQLVVILRIGGFAAAAAAEGEYILVRGFLAETVGMQIDAVLAVFGSANQHLLAFFQQAEFLDHNPAVFKHGHAVHAAFFRQQPLTIHLHLFGVDAHGVKVFRRNPVFFHGNKHGVRRGKKGLLRKIRVMIGAKFEHDNASLVKMKSAVTASGTAHAARAAHTARTAGAAVLRMAAAGTNPMRGSGAGAARAGRLRPSVRRGSVAVVQHGARGGAANGGHATAVAQGVGCQRRPCAQQGFDNGTAGNFHFHTFVLRFSAFFRRLDRFLHRFGRGDIIFVFNGGVAVFAGKERRSRIRRKRRAAGGTDQFFH